MHLSLCRTGRGLLLFLLISAALTAQSQTLTLTPSKDNTLYDDPAGALSAGAGDRIFAGVNAQGQRRRAVLAFDLSGIPAGSTIVSATLQLNVLMSVSANVPITVHPLLADWGEAGSLPVGGAGGGGAGGPAAPGDATWIHTFSPSSFWMSPGGDFSPTPSLTLNVAFNGVYSAGSSLLAADVQAWVNNPATNFGWLLRSPETGSSTAKAFASRENITPSQRPQLTVVYTASAMAGVTSTGTGCTVLGVSPLTLSAVGLPMLGNGSFAVTLTNGTAGAPAFYFLAFGLEPNPVPLGFGCSIYLNLASLTQLVAAGISPIGPLPMDPSGTSFLPVPIPVQPSLIGATIDVQGAIADPSGPSGILTSNALTLQFGL